MGIVEFLLFLIFLIFPTIHSENVCSSSSCGDIQIKYPFKLQAQGQLEPGNKCTFINLTCTSQKILALNIPLSGDFDVRYINYLDNTITLQDPRNCLPARLLNNSINLSSSPFTPAHYERLTFYTCPKDSDPVVYYATPIACLGNSTNATIALSQESAHDHLEHYGCKNIGSSLFPMMFQGQYDYRGINDDLPLFWKVPDCEYCDSQSPPHQTTGESKLVKLLRSPFVGPFILLMILYCTYMTKKRRDERNTVVDQNLTIATAAAPISHESIEMTILPIVRPTGRLDESRIERYTEMVVVGENQGILGQGNSSCPICLEAYNNEDKVRRIGKCGHFFHGDCIVSWLRKNNTCPVCRTSLTHVQT